MKDIEQNNPVEIVEDGLTFLQVEEIMGGLTDDINSEETANDARALNGYEGLSGYVRHTYGSPEFEPVEQGIRDLLGDLRHLCDALDLDFDDLSERSERVYPEEVESPLG